MAKVSVIMPVYNDAEYLEESLDSVTGQTLEDIEIICVDDHSDDGSLEILKRYQEKDPRIRILTHEENLSASQCRKDGVAASTGEYIMFLDSDDAYMENACEEASRAIFEAGTDILQFGSEVVNCSGVPEERIRLNEKILQPHTETTLHGDMVEYCWVDTRFRFTLWNKIFRGENCRQAFAEIEDGSFPKAQDLYAFFLIAAHSRSYAGIDTVLYRYNFGRGVTGKAKIDLPYFERILTEKRVSDALRRYIGEKELAQYEEVIDTIEMNFQSDGFSNLLNNLKEDQKEEGRARYIEVWGYRALVCAAARRRWELRMDIFSLLTDACKTETPKYREIRTVAMYYRNIRLGGAQRVAAQLASMWADLTNEDGSPRFKVLLVTDEPDELVPTPEWEENGITADMIELDPEFQLSPNVIREYLPARKISIGKNFPLRYDAWTEILDRHQVDAVVNGLWVDSSFFWDFLVLKGHPSRPAMVMHCHSFMATPYMFKGPAASNVAELLKIVDGSVVLTETDREYARYFSDYCRVISNPLFFRTEETPVSSCEGHDVLWVGRLDDYKRPLDAIMIAEEVRKVIPDVKLYMAGGGDEKKREVLEQYIADNQLQDTVYLLGFVENVGELYEKSSVFLATTEFEGLFTAMTEAMGYGLPVVSYDLPWLPQFEDGRGVTAVPQKDIAGAARALISLLQDPEKRKADGRAARTLVEDYERTDYAGLWADFFDHLPEPHDNPEKNSRMAVLLNHIAQFQQQAKYTVESGQRAEINKLKDERKELWDVKRERGLEIRELRRVKKERGEEIHVLRREKKERGDTIREQKKQIEAQKKEINWLKSRLLYRVERKTKDTVKKILHKS